MIKRMMIALVAAAVLVAMAIPAFAYGYGGVQFALAACEDVTNSATATGGDANTGAQNSAEVAQSNAVVAADGSAVVAGDDIKQFNAAEVNQFAWAEDTGNAQGGDALAIAAACNAVNVDITEVWRG